MWDEYDYDEGSDVDNWENEEVFQDGVLDRQTDYWHGEDLDELGSEPDETEDLYGE